MISPRWRKALRDLWVNRARTAVVALAVAVGVASAGAVLSAYTILTREMAESFSATRPATAIITMPSATPNALSIARSHPGVAAAETRGVAHGRVLVAPNAWRPIELFVIPDFQRQAVSLVEAETAVFPSRDDQIALERSSLQLYAPAKGANLTIRANGAERELGYAGTTHDAGEAPAWMEGTLYGYLTEKAAASLKIAPRTELLLRAPGATTEAAARGLAYDVKRDLEAGGERVQRVQVFKPGAHPHSSQMQTLLFLLEAFGVVALVLSCVIVASLVSSMLARQVREIGAMKAVGATSLQVAGVYAAGVALLGVIAVALGIPAGVAGGRAYATFAMGVLNFDVADYSIPAWVFAVEVLIGIGAPLLVSAIPLARGARVTVREAITDTGITDSSGLSARVESGLAKLRGIRRDGLLALRNTVRRPGRLALALVTLATGGAGFIAAMSAGATWTRTVDDAWKAWGWDLEAVLPVAQPGERVTAALRGVDGVASVELWRRADAVAIRAGSTDGAGATVMAAPPGSTSLNPSLMTGRWLEPGDSDAVVLNQSLANSEGVCVGDRISFRLTDGRVTSWQVVGVAKEIATAAAYVPYARFGQVVGPAGMAEMARVRASAHDVGSVRTTSANVERALDRAGMPAAFAASTRQVKQGLDAHILIFVTLMTIMSALIVIVGGLGLVSLMSVNVMERMRELGVLQALGATSHQIVRVVVAEGVAVGALSWVIAMVVSLPLSGVLGQVGGAIFIQAPLTQAYSVPGALTWLAVVLALSGAASALPALRASRRAVRETLAYQ